MMRRVVVVGGSIAAVTAAETLRLEGFDGTITVLSQESVGPYTRVPLSKGVLAGTESLEDIALPAVSDDIEVLTGVKAEKLDVAQKIVQTNSGPFRWDGLVIATGARARRLAPTLDEYVVREHGDSVDLSQGLATASSVLVIGGGFLGMEVASSAITLGKSVTVLDCEPALQRLLGETVAARVRQVAAHAGVTFHVDPGGARLLGEPGARPRGAITASGRVFEADLVISAAGDQPNVEWLAGSGLDIDGGVLVDSFCRAHPGIVAAGDVAAMADPEGRIARNPSWTNAVEQARAAVRSLVRGEAASHYEPSHYFWTEQFGIDIKISGPPMPDSQLKTDEGWNNGTGSLLTWGSDAPTRVLGWNHRLKPAQLKRMTKGRTAVA